MRLDITFPGGVAVDARHQGFVIHTDQPVEAGGRGAAPSPFDLFLASIGTCGGLYALRFCQERDIATEGLAVRLEVGAVDRGRITELRLEVQLPDDFPEKYRDAIVRAVDHCSVKRHLVEPPKIVVAVSENVAAAMG